MATNRSKRPGFSLMMVTAVVAVAAVLGLAILTSNTLQVQASSSQDRVVQAHGGLVAQRPRHAHPRLQHPRRVGQRPVQV